MKRALRDSDPAAVADIPPPVEPRPPRLGLDFLDMSIPFSKGSGRFQFLTLHFCELKCAYLFKRLWKVFTIRDVNLHLFGGIPLFFFRPFRFFSNDFLLFFFFFKWPKEKNTGLQHRHYWESLKSFGKQSLTSSVSGQSSKASYQGSARWLAASWLEEGTGVSTRGRFDLWLVTCCLEKGEGRVVLMWRDGERLVHFAHRKACVVCQVCTFTCPGSEFFSPPPPSPLSPSSITFTLLSKTHMQSQLSHTGLSLSPSYTQTHTHIHTCVRVFHGNCLYLWCSLSLKHTHTRAHSGTT